MKGGNKMKAKETAVVLIEFQNEFCKEGGKLHDGVKGEIDRQNTIPNAREGTWGAEIIDELKPQEGDKVVGGKCTLCGFNKTNLDELLNEGNIKNVVIGGFLTNFCVESTARTAYDRGYGVTIMKDATAATSEEEQNHAEAKIFPLLGQTLSVDQFLEQLEE
jgi:ureidoacrylate peracid hydrolase